MDTCNYWQACSFLAFFQLDLRRPYCVQGKKREMKLVRVNVGRGEFMRRIAAETCLSTIQRKKLQKGMGSAVKPPPELTQKQQERPVLG